MKNKIFLFIILLYSSSCLSLIYIDTTFVKISTTIVCVMILGFLLITNRLHIRTSILEKYIYIFLTLPFISALSATLLHNQDIVISIRATLFNLAYVTFFLLYAIKTKVKDISMLFCILGVIWCLIEIIQQFTYPAYLFASRIETMESSIEIRNGIYRYGVTGSYFGIFLIFYCFEKLLANKNRLFVMGFILGLIGIYLTTTRLLIAAVIFCICIGLLLTRKIKLKSLVLFGIIGVIIYQYSDILFGSFVEKTQNDLNEDYIRFQTYTFYGLEYNNSLLAILLGNGQFSADSFYGQEILKYRDLGLYQSDIGIVGLYSLYGIAYVINILFLFFSLIRKRKFISLHLQLYCIFLLITSVTLPHFGYSVHSIICTCFVFYVVDKSIYNNTWKKQKYEVLNNNTSI